MKQQQVTEAELQAYVDGLLPPARRADVADYLALRPAEARRLRIYGEQNRALRTRFNPLLDQTVPARLHRRPRYMRRMVACAMPLLRRLGYGLLLALAGGIGGWVLHGRQAAPLPWPSAPAARNAVQPERVGHEVAPARGQAQQARRWAAGDL